jgi:hypothetical protein
MHSQIDVATGSKKQLTFPKGHARSADVSITFKNYFSCAASLHLAQRCIVSALR